MTQTKRSQREILELQAKRLESRDVPAPQWSRCHYADELTRRCHELAQGRLTKKQASAISAAIYAAFQLGSLTPADVKAVRMADGREVMVAAKNGDTLEIELLLNNADKYGTVTVHGEIYKASKEQLLNVLKWIYDVSEVKVLRMTLVP